MDGRRLVFFAGGDGVGTRGGQVWVLTAGRKKQALSSIRLDSPVISTPVAAGGTLYVGTMKRLYALQEGTQKN